MIDRLVRKIGFLVLGVALAFLAYWISMSGFWIDSLWSVKTGLYWWCASVTSFIVGLVTFFVCGVGGFVGVGNDE